MEQIKYIRIASRASKLALSQSDYVKNLLRQFCGDIEISIVEVSTRGDRDKSEFLYEPGTIGFFTSEVERAVLDGRADVAVHSFKDLPTTDTAGLVIAAVPKRELAADALVAFGNVASIDDLQIGATVGTSSFRRIALLKHLRSDLNCVGLRGNVETRVDKVMNGQIDAAILACAGLNRLGLADKISAILPPQEFIPAPAQGALAVQVRSCDSELAELVSKIEDKYSRITAETERCVLARMKGGCSIPVGVYSQISCGIVNIDAVISDIEGKKYIKLSATAPVEQAKICGRRLADKMLDAGGQEILDQIRDAS